MKKMIFDIGMHTGEDTDFYLKKGFRVVSVEADPDHAEAGSKRFSNYLDDGQLIIVNKAIAAHKGRVQFFKFENISGWGTIDAEMAERGALVGGKIREMSVEAIEFSELLDTYGVPHYMKVDIEGVDDLCLKGLIGRPERPNFISIESSRESFVNVMEELLLLHKLGYHSFKVVGQHRVDLQKLPNPPLEGQFVDQRFKKGHSSGSFGMELPGDWLNTEQAVKEYLGIFKFYRMTGHTSTISKSALQVRNENSGINWKWRARKIAKRLAKRMGYRTPWYDTHAMLSSKNDQPV